MCVLAETKAYTLCYVENIPRLRGACVFSHRESLNYVYFDLYAFSYAAGYRAVVFEDF